MILLFSLSFDAQVPVSRQDPDGRPLVQVRMPQGSLLFKSFLNDICRVSPLLPEPVTEPPPPFFKFNPCSSFVISMFKDRSPSPLEKGGRTPRTPVKNRHLHTVLKSPSVPLNGNETRRSLGRLEAAISIVPGYAAPRRRLNPPPVLRGFFPSVHPKVWDLPSSVRAL